MLTGCRRNEVLGLRWEDVGFETGELRLRDSKTGARLLPLTPAAAEVLETCPVCPAILGVPWKKRGTHQRNINDSWDRIRKRAGLDGVRLHDLRALIRLPRSGAGGKPSMIGKLLGHTQVQTTARYAHLARESVKASTAKVAESIGANILPPEPERSHRDDEFDELD